MKRSISIILVTALLLSCIGITGCGKGKPDFELSAESSNITLPESIAYSLKG
jgi:hypothetical protein